VDRRPGHHRPECGTHLGGSALYLASICELIGHGRVLSIDIEALPGRPHHPRIDYVTGPSVDPGIVDRVGREARERRAMVVLDSDHAEAHVLAEVALTPLTRSAPTGYVRRRRHLGE
jgi:cephalosporin hydroxylase